MIVGIDGVGIMCMEKDSERLGIHASHVTKLYELKERERGREAREGGILVQASVSLVNQTAIFVRGRGKARK